MTLDVGGTHDVVLGHQLVLFHNTEDIASTDDIALLEVQGVVQPLLLVIERTNIGALGDVWRLGLVVDDFERSLDTIEDVGHDAGSKFDGKRISSSQNGITNSKTSCLLVALNGGGIAFQFDDFTNKFVETDSNEFVHGGTGHVIGDDQRSRDFQYASV